MKYTFALATITAFAAAQTIADLPSCSLPCLIESIAGIGCSTTDFSCSCPKAAQLTPAVTKCVAGACSSAADQAKVLTVLSGLCASAGFPINVAPSSSAAAVSSSKPVVSSAAPTTTSQALSSYDLTPSQTPTPTTSAISTPTPTSTRTTVGTTSSVRSSGSGVQSSTLPVFTGAAAAIKVPAAVAGAFGLAALVL